MLRNLGVILAVFGSALAGVQSTYAQEFMVYTATDAGEFKTVSFYSDPVRSNLDEFAKTLPEVFSPLFNLTSMGSYQVDELTLHLTIDANSKWVVVSAGVEAGIEIKFKRIPGT